MKIKIILPLLSFIFLSFSSFGQVFFKQRIYNMEDREPRKEGIYLEGTYSSYTVPVKSRGRSYEVDNYPQTDDFKDQELHTIKYFGFYFIGSKENNRVSGLKASALILRELGEEKLAQSILRIRTVSVTAKLIQIPAWIMIIDGSFRLATAEQEDNVSPKVLYIGIGTFITSKVIMGLSRTSLNHKLNKYNNRISSRQNKINSNFTPSKITFKPVQISPLVPSLAPTLGFSWNL